MSNNDLTEKDASVIKGMVERGDEQHNVAAWFGINHGRISEISNGNAAIGEKFKYIKPAEESTLPPPGPYTSGQSAARAIQMLDDLEKIILNSISGMKNELRQNDNILKENYARVKKRKDKAQKNKISPERLEEILGNK